MRSHPTSYAHTRPVSSDEPWPGRMQILAGDPGSQWSVLAIENDLVRALLAAGDSDPETRQVAHRLANVLVSYGYQSFRALV